MANRLVYRNSLKHFRRNSKFLIKGTQNSLKIARLDEIIVYCSVMMGFDNSDRCSRTVLSDSILGQAYSKRKRTELSIKRIKNCHIARIRLLMMRNWPRPDKSARALHARVAKVWQCYQQWLTKIGNQIQTEQLFRLLKRAHCFSYCFFIALTSWRSFCSSTGNDSMGTRFDRASTVSLREDLSGVQI